MRKCPGRFIGWRAGARGAAVGAALLVAGIAGAAESRWVVGPYSSSRLILAAQPDAAALRAGLELRLEPGWKTYWRYPGDAGLPPRFDFSASSNVRAVDVAWPAPHRFEAAGTVSIGYADSVVFPLTVHPVDPARPVTLSVSLDYAVCGTLCIPAAAQLQLTAPPALSAAVWTAAVAPKAMNDAAALLRRAEARVPRSAELGGGGALAITALSLDRTRQPWRVTVDAVAPADAELFAEGPNAEWALPVPSAPVPTSPATVRFTFDLDGAPASFDAAETRLTLTLVANGQANGQANEQAIETTAPLE